MATIVPISHSIRWRSRSRNSSMDLVDQQQQLQVSPSLGSPCFENLHIASDASEWDEEPSDDEDESFDEFQSSAWLVVPREFANVTQRRRSSWGESAPVSPHSGAGYNDAAKSMERRRANGSGH